MSPVGDLRPIIVGGCHRSGTSLVRRILDAHPRIYCGPEVKFFRDFYGDYFTDPIRHLRFLESARSMLADDELLELLGGAFVEMHERAARAAGKVRWADKAPENVVFLEDWHRLLGDDWVFLHVVRNPLDTLASIKENEFPLSIPTDLDGRLRRYLQYTQAGLDFGDSNPRRYARVLYEDLVSRPEPTLRPLMERLGEDLYPDQLAIDPNRHQAGLEDPKIATTAEIHPHSISRWRRDLTSEEVKAIVQATAEVWSKIDQEGLYPLL